MIDMVFAWIARNDGALIVSLFCFALVITAWAIIDWSDR
jgi:hypothetical protein